jgi:hypothetical protein
MANRTPVSGPSFATPPNNPQALQGHQFWGQYSYSTATPPNSHNGRTGDIGSSLLPNASVASALSNPEFSKLEEGDLASTITTGVLDSENGLWFCVYPGTVGAGNAVWARLDNMASTVQQTIRDAHAIVVGQGEYLAPLFGATPPPVDRLNLGASGEQLSITVDFLDAGDCSQLASAFAVALAAAVPIDIRLRPCALDLGLGATPAPLNLPANCRLIGAGRNQSSIASKTAGGATQQVLAMGDNCELIDLTITSPSAVAAPGVGGFGVVQCGKDNRIFACAFSLFAATGASRTQRYAVYDPTASAQIAQCRFDGASDSIDPLASPSVAISFGDDGAPNFLVVPLRPWEVSDCTFGNSAKNTGWNEVLRVANVSGGAMHDCYAFSIERPINGVINIVYSGVPTNPQTVIAPIIRNVRVKVEFETQGDASYYAFRLRNLIDNQTVTAPQWDDCFVVFTAAGDAAVSRYAYRMLASGTLAIIDSGSISDCVAAGHTVGIDLTAQGVSARAESVRLTGCNVKSPSAVGAVLPQGINLNATPGCSVSACGIVNCSAIGAPPAGFGLRVQSAAVVNTTIGFNNLTASGGTAYLDASGTSEAAHNIL